MFECSAEELAEIERHGHCAEPVPAEEPEALRDDPLYRQLSRMTEDELCLYADRRFKLVFHSGVRKPEMIAAILAREKG